MCAISRCYYLPVGGGKQRVCLAFFCATLNVKPRAVQKALEVRAKSCVTVGAIADRRGRHNSATKTPEWKLNIIRDHIRMYPTMDSHYCRKSSTRRYLDPSLSISKMYDQFQAHWQTLDFTSYNSNSSLASTSSWQELEDATLFADDDCLCEPAATSSCIAETSTVSPVNVIAAPSENVYRKVFCTEFNLSFFSTEKRSV